MLARAFAVLTLLATAACGGGGNRAELDGATLYELHGCATCHGDGGEGRSLGPPLADLGRHWDRENLARYLLDPEAVIAEDPRLSALDAEYPSEMRPFRNTTPEERLRIADFLLALD